MEKRFWFIANWKMYQGVDETLKFVTHNLDALVVCARHAQTTIVLCPSFPLIYSVGKILETTGIFIGAQDCSSYLQGAFTGQVSAQVLQSLGCHYCIVGHSESRKYLHYKTDDIINKIQNILSCSMIPVICFGESEEDYKKGMSFQALESQIAPVVDFMKKINIAKKVIIAYEPEWAIGSDNSAPVEHLESVFVWLHNMVNVLASAGKCRLLYGGSVSSKNMGKLRFIEHLDGFLLGRASLDFQEFEKIVKYTI